MIADLHVHTNASDGLFSPEDIMLQAAAAGLAHIAITDHDTMDGIATIKSRPAAAGGTELIPGIEFSTDLPLHEVHILGYYIDVTHPELNRQLRLIRENRLERVEKMVDRLNKLGFPLEYSRVREIAGGAAAVGRPHVAAALVERGYFSNIAAVFDALLEKNKPAYIPHFKLSPQQTIALIVSAGGLPVLAHPGLVNNEELVLSTLQSGIRGIEVYHPRHTPEQVSRYLKLAGSLKLAVTGGSDFHGISGRYPAKLGEYTIPDELALALRHSRHARR
jgi:3',5'-nucleoside bisphosphate phosphatase